MTLEELAGNPPSASRLAAPERIRSLYGSLYEIERKTLELIVLRIGIEPFSWPRLEQAGQKRMSGAAMKVGLIRLIKAGILFAVKKNWGEPLYVLPEDTFGEWRRLVAPLQIADVLYNGAEAAAETPQMPGLPVCLLIATAYAAKQPAAFAQKGQLLKRHEQKLAAQMPPGEELLADVAQLAPKAVSQQPALAFVLDIACRFGVLEKRADRLAVRPAGAREWFAKSEQEMHRLLYEDWRKTAGAADVAMRHAISFLETLPQDRWFDPSIAAKQVYAVTQAPLPAAKKTAAQHEFAERLTREWLMPLCYWGWMELGRSPDGRQLARWRINPAASGEDRAGLEPKRGQTASPVLYIQPDFEVIVPPGCPYHVRWELEMIAERVRCEQVSVYRLTRESVMNALERGRTAGEIAAMFDAFGKYGVPDNVRQAIVQWEEQKNMLRMERVTVLRCRDEASARAVEGDSRIAALLGEPLSPCMWIVPEARAAELRVLLEKSGYRPGMADNGSDQGEEDLYLKLDEGRTAHEPLAEHGSQRAAEENGAAENVGGEALIYSRASVQYDVSEGEVPSIEAIYPGLHEVPSMWLKECRAYHPSTRKEMVRKALEWKASLKLRKSGEEIVLIPQRMDGMRGDWAVTGYHMEDEVRLSHDQWEEMQLILPGIND
jgi:hypothetical protein